MILPAGLTGMGVSVRVIHRMDGDGDEEENQMVDYNTIEYAVTEAGIGVLSLNRPRRYNSVDEEMMAELEAFWRDRLYDLDGFRAAH